MSNVADQQYRRMTETPIPRLIISLGIPTTISMLVTNIYNMADTFFVGTLGTSASGAIGIVFGFMSIIQAFGFMYGQGAGSIISRKLGQKDTEAASAYASIGFFLSLATGTLLSLIGFLGMNPLLRLLGSTETILPYARTYVTYIMFSSPLMMSSFTLNNILRYEGKASLAMVGLVAGAILNIIGDPIFMFVFHMGIAGAGLSTALSQCVSFIILLSAFLRGKTQSRLALRNFQFDKKVWEIVSTGFPSLIRQGLTTLSTMVLNHCAAAYGDAAIAAMSIVSRINFFMFAIGLGIGQGFQPVAGYNYGSQKYSRVRKAFRFTLLASEGVLGVMSIIGLLLSPAVVGWFRNDPEVIAIGSIALRYQCIALLFQPLSVTSNMTFQITGQRALASFTAMLRSGLYFIPAITILTLLTGIWGVETAQAITDVLTFFTVLPLIIRFFRNMPRDDVSVQN
ncbi:MAG: MATE family efflux transporter [Clostridiales bacterium]|nr:MATE family efflux transporter [Clostridiales bacterium]